MHVYIYICVCIYKYIYVYIHTYTHILLYNCVASAVVAPHAGTRSCRKHPQISAPFKCQASSTREYIYIYIYIYMYYTYI